MYNNEKIYNLDDDQEIWPGRFNVIAEVEGYQFLDTRWTVRMHVYSQTLSHTDASSRDACEEFAGDEYGIQARFTFTEKQADDLVSFINTLEGCKALKFQANKPNQRLSFLRWIWVDNREGEGLHRFSDEESYPVDFDAVGFFDIKLAARIGPESEQQLWFEIDRALEPLTYNERDWILQLALDLVKESVDK